MRPPTTTPLRRGAAILVLTIYAALIFGGSSGSAPTVITELGLPDYLLHGAEFAALGFLASRAVLHLTLRTGWGLLFLLPGALATLYGASDELHQAFVPSRDSDVVDLLADAVGSFTGAFVYRAVLLRWLRRDAEPDADGGGS